MNKVTCRMCKNMFYAPSKVINLPCPFCSHTIKGEEADRRDRSRQVASSGCDLVRGDIRLPVKTVDISSTGLGIKMMGYLPFKEDELVEVYIRDLDIEARARVVWTKRFYGISRAGLQFHY